MIPLVAFLFAPATADVAGLARPQLLDSTMGWEILGGCPHHFLQEAKMQG